MGPTAACPASYCALATCSQVINHTNHQQQLNCFMEIKTIFKNENKNIFHEHKYKLIVAEWKRMLNVRYRLII
jgi:hypothetical protein